jgi:hypothetical protein
MHRFALLVALGLVLGAVVIYSIGRHDTSDATDSRAALGELGSGAAAAPPRGAATLEQSGIALLELVTGSVSADERAALYRLAGAADANALESLAVQAAGLPTSLRGRALALEALLTRYAELDAPAAARFTVALPVPSEVQARVFASWAGQDARAALQALDNLDSRTALAAGAAILGVIGNDELGLARVLDAAPKIDADRLRAEAAVATAALDPEAALGQVFRVPPSKRGEAVTRIAAAWVENDVYGALAHLDAMTDGAQRSELRAALLVEWARSDPDAALGYVQQLDAESQRELHGAALRAYLLVDPKRALEVAATLSGEAGALARRSALMSYARDDPLAALRYVETLPPGVERSQSLTMVASSYARRDPEAALAWAEALSPPAPDVLANVLAELARADWDRAFDRMAQLPVDVQQRTLRTLIASRSLASGQVASLADRMLAESHRPQALQQFTTLWAQREPAEALDWWLRNADRAPRNMVAHAAVHLARTDPNAAVAYLDRVPSEQRASWLRFVAEGYAEKDAHAAARWVSEHRGEAGYDAAVVAVAARSAGADPAGAARQLASIDWSRAPDAPAAARAVAAAWAEQEPTGAARWAEALADEGARTIAAAAVAAQWSQRDAVAARSWAFALPTSTARDAALVQVLGTSEGVSLDQRVLDAFSGTAAREHGIGDAVRMIAQRDPARALAIADRYLTDPDARRAAQRFIEQPVPKRFDPAAR